MIPDVPKKSDEIRRLHAAGKSISEIAKTLGIRYQHAYNVLKRSPPDRSNPATVQAIQSAADAIEKLLSLGFRHIGFWELEHEKLNYHTHEKPQGKKVLYAFASDRKLLYIGKSIQSLKGRMNNYKFGNKGQKTSFRIQAEIIGLLRQGMKVDIFFMPDPGLLQYGGYPINLAAGLEDSLIRALLPAWNIAGK